MGQRIKQLDHLTSRQILLIRDNGYMVETQGVGQISNSWIILYDNSLCQVERVKPRELGIGNKQSAHLL